MALDRKRRTWLRVASYLAVLIQLTESLSFSAVHIPALVQRNANFWLSCQFKLADNEQLYSVKWYRNNEEFYRLQVADNQQQQQVATLPPSPPDFWQPASQSPIQPLQQQQQQYFSQEGLNVMMSSSNATHVRLLNGSLESEGLFACEISTQNLSTIRYEKEIRVYVLPNSRLSIIGLRNRYAVNDRVDLICASDYSRAQPALAWFINGRRIGKTSQWFALDSQRKSKQANLVRLQLGLKFKLSPQLLASLAEQRNQSLANGLAKLKPFRRRKRHAAQRLPSPSSPLPANPMAAEFELKLQCKYKLTEVSDVTFNELSLSVRNRKSTATAGVSGGGGGGGEWRRRRKRQVSVDFEPPEVPVQLAKTAQNQVTQSRSPAPMRDLWQALGVDRAACQVGAPALQPEDPLIVSGITSDEAPWPSSEPISTDRKRRRRRRQREDEESDDDRAAISVTCLTISALLATPKTAAGGGEFAADFGGGETSTSAQRAPNFCADPVSRRRALISGRYQTNEEQVVSSSASNHHRGNGQHLTTSNRSVALQQQQQQLRSSNSPAVAYLALTEPLTWSRASTTAESSELSSLPSTWSSSWSLSAPPLLEWFINNQEAPQSSVSSSQPPGGVAGNADSTPVALPVTDYADYFANFDNRPLQQQLALNLTLDKKHFMTPDAQLRLRCSSTQAQVLLTDSASVSIVTLAPRSDAQLQPLGWNQRTNQRQRQVHNNNQAHLAARSNGAPQSAVSSGLNQALTAFLLSALLLAHYRCQHPYLYLYPVR